MVYLDLNVWVFRKDTQDKGENTVQESVKSTESLAHIEYKGVQISLLGTAHVSQASADEVQAQIDSGAYDAVALELCKSRHQNLVDPDAITKLDLLQIIREGKGAMVLANLALGAFQQRTADKLGVEPGADMRTAITAAADHKLPTLLVDRDIGTTLKRIYRSVPFLQRFKILSHLIASIITRRTVSEEEIEHLKKGDVIESTFAQFAESAWNLYEPLVDERDRFMVARLKQEAESSGYQRILAVVGAGHVAGMRRYFEDEGASVQEQNSKSEIEQLNTIPPGSSWWKAVPWAIVGIILIGFGIGFSQSAEIGWHMVQNWVLINGGLAAIGAMIAAAHPITIASAFAAAPLTSLNPMIGAGMVTAAVESYMRKPQVGDFNTLRHDTGTISGWWSNRVARTMLVFLFTGIGSVIGTYIAGYKIFETIA